MLADCHGAAPLAILRRQHLKITKQLEPHLEHEDVVIIIFDVKHFCHNSASIPLLTAGFSCRRVRSTNPMPPEWRNELAAFHSITSSARASNVAGISRPSVLAVLRLNAVWKCDGALMGTSPALPPLATWSTNAAMSRNTSTMLTP
jgi:hypothetical protein